LEFRVSFRAVALSEPEADGQNLVHDQNLVCAFPKLQSPSGLPAAAYLAAAFPSRKTLRAGGQRFGSAFLIPKIAPFRKTF